MAYIGLIVESPSKCGKIEKFLGAGYKCMASCGHLRTLNKLDDIDINNNFKPTYKIIDEKKKVINLLKKFINNASEIILATDDDREGEAIAWHICDIFNLNIKTTKRLIFHEITKPAIEQAIFNPTTLNMNLVYAQQARQIMDLLVGFKISPFLWKNISKKTKSGLSAGRCQTPALNLIYDNYKEQLNTANCVKYITDGFFTKYNIKFKLNQNFKNKEDVLRFINSSINFDYKLLECKKENIKHSPPKPFTTSRIQQMSSNIFNFSPKKTMMICQKLYELGYITYMRTDSAIYSFDFIEKAHFYINKVFGKRYINMTFQTNTNATKTKKTNSITQDAHEAIRPTNINITSIEDLDKSHQKMYNLIWENTIESLMTDAIISRSTQYISAPSELTYSYQADKHLFLGWNIVKNNKIEDPYYEYFSLIQQNQSVTCNMIKSEKNITNIKQHYSEARLVNILEEKGIGRPSTFSSLVDKIQLREYVKKQNIEGKSYECEVIYLDDKNNILTDSITKVYGNEKNKLKITSLGIIVIEFLLHNIQNIFNYEYTSNMEKALDDVSNGKIKWYNLCQMCLNEINKNTTKIITSNKEEYQIDDNNTYMIGKYGPVIKHINPNDKSISFLKVKDEIDIKKLKVGELSLNDIIKDDNSTGNLNILGKIDNIDIVIKEGKYGKYVIWNKKPISIKKINEYLYYEDDDADNTLSFNPNKEITIDDLKKYIKHLESTNSLERKITSSIEIKKSKYGHYIYYKTNKMKKPKFYKLDGFKHDYLKCDKNILREWIKKKYKI